MPETTQNEGWSGGFIRRIPMVPNWVTVLFLGAMILVLANS